MQGMVNLAWIPFVCVHVALAVTAPELESSKDATEAAEATGSYFFILGDWGVARGTNGHQCQQDIADKMKDYAKAQGAAPLLVASVGDNFYGTGMESEADWKNVWSDVYGPNDASSGLYNVPWYSVLGNHDLGNGDLKCACGECKQMDSYDGRPEDTKLYHMPDYNWYKEFPSAGLEVIGVESNIFDINGLGGDGMGGYGANQVPGACGGQDAVKNFLQSKYDEGVALVQQRAQQTTASVVLIMNHYPKWMNVPQKLVEAFKQYNKNVTVVSAYGHTHKQICDEGPDSQCSYIMSGGGGGYTADGTLGFVAVHLDGEGGYNTKITDASVTVNANECSICDRLPDCLWASNPSLTGYYVGGAAAGVSLATATALAFAFRRRGKGAVAENVPEAATSTLDA